MVRYDAISRAAFDTIRALEQPGRVVQHFGAACDFPSVQHRPCDTVADLLLDPHYRAANVAIFHFGIHHSLFDALLVGGPPLNIVAFHNVTPPQFVAPAERPLIERSLQQVNTLRRANEIWAVSPANATMLHEHGFDPARIRIVPLVVEDPAPARLASKTNSPIELLCMGRIAPSKGLHDLIAAMTRLGLSPGSVVLTIAGNTSWSDPHYLQRLRDLIETNSLQHVVRFSGTIDDAERERLFHAAHVLVAPSYHEGFCRPVAEGLRAGCIPLVYDAYNLPLIAAGLGRVVPPGDIDALAASIAALARALPHALQAPHEALLELDRGPTSVLNFDDLAAAHVATFSADAVGGAVRTRLADLLG